MAGLPGPAAHTGAGGIAPKQRRSLPADADSEASYDDGDVATVSPQRSLVRTRDDELDALRRQLEKSEQRYAFVLAADERAKQFRDEGVDALIRDVTRLRAATEGPAAAAKNAGLVKRILDEGTDTSASRRVVELEQALDAMTLERNRLQAALNATRKLHADVLAEAEARHAAEVADLKAKLMHVNDLLHNAQGHRVAAQLGRYKRELFELKEALFVMREEMRKANTIFVAEQPFAALTAKFAELSAANDQLRRERDAALNFVHVLRRDVSDLWNGIPQLDDLRKNLGRRSDTQPLVGAIRTLTDRFLEVVLRKSHFPAVGSQCNLMHPQIVERVVEVDRTAPKPALSDAALQTPAEWMVPERRPSVAKRRSTVRVVNRQPSVISEKSLMSVGPPPRPWSRNSASSLGGLSVRSPVPSPNVKPLATTASDYDDDDQRRKSIFDVSPLAPSRRRASSLTVDGDGGDDEEEAEEGGEVVVEVDWATEADALAAIDEFRMAQLRRFAFGRWMRRFGARQTKRICNLIVDRHLNARGVADGGAIVAKPATPRPPPKTTASDPRPHTARSAAAAGSAASKKVLAGELVLQSQSTPRKRGGARNGGSDLVAKSDVKPADPLSSWGGQGGGWRYGHVRTVVPAHQPRPQHVAPAATRAAMMRDGGFQSMSRSALDPDSMRQLLSVQEQADDVRDLAKGRTQPSAVSFMTTATTGVS